MTLYRSETVKNFFFNVIDGETPDKYLTSFISKDWKTSALQQYNDYAKENNLEEIESSEIDNMNTFNAIVYLTNKIPEAPSYNFIEVEQSEIDEMINEGIELTNIKTDYEFEQFIDVIGSYWDAK